MVEIDLKRFAVLYVDDEEKSLKWFRHQFGGKFRVVTATNVRDALGLLESEDVGVIITDQRMPGETGVDLLRQARQLRPDTVRMLVTAYTDYGAVVESINSGAVAKYIHKPWEPAELKATLEASLAYFAVHRERGRLVREREAHLNGLANSHQVVNLGLLAAGLGHYVHNALTAVRIFLDLLPAKLAEERGPGAESGDPDYWVKFYQSVQAQIVRITSLLVDLGSAPEKPVFPLRDRVAVAEVICAALEASRAGLEEKGIAVATDLGPDLPDLPADRPKFERLFVLLLKDEIINLPPGSRIEIAARLDGGAVVVELSDDGPGLPEDDLRSVFDPFFIRKDDPQEFGINLMACYFIVYHHGGSIGARTRPEGGLAFTLRFPLEPEAPRAPGEDALLESVLAIDAGLAGLSREV